MEGRGRVPEVATPRMTAAAFGVFFLLGAVSTLSVVAGLDPSPARTQLAALAAVAAAAGAACVVLRHRLGRTVLHVLVALGTVLIGVGALVAPDAQTALLVGVLLVFVAVDSAVFFTLPWGLTHLACCLATGTAALLARGDVAATQAVALDVVLLAVAAVVRVLAVRASSASVDPLTGLPNRRGLDEALSRAALEAERDGDPLVVGLLDLDGFGAVNDALGHEAGDALLRETATAWRAGLPVDVVLARLGGDEFAVLLPGRDPDAATALLDPLCRDGERPASAGVAQLRVGEPFADVLRRADVALYRAKSSGRGRCLAADEGDLADESRLLADLRRALGTGGLDVHYQVLRDVGDVAALGTSPEAVGGAGEVVGVEALVRWRHPVHGPVSPEVFVGLAERSGLAPELGATVLERACRDLVTVRASGLLPRRAKLGVNVSGLELVDRGYVARLARVLETTGWPAGDLVLEVTESVVEADSRAALATLRDVAALGVLLAVDDFGTGYSALSRLDEIGADYLKLDSSFTATVHTSAKRRRLVRAVATLGRSLDLWVIAEGVESAAQSELLSDLGCELQQGFHLGRPLPVGGLLDLLARDQARATAPAAPAATAGGEPLVPGQTRGTAASTDLGAAPVDLPALSRSTPRGP